METEKTRQLFAPLIQRPPLTDQLLQRPPFKFLHDVINATIQNTGFLLDTFTSEELDSSAMKDKATKVEFLQKLITALNDDGSLKSVKAAKIVAGKEPELTNLLLQKLAKDAASYQTRNGQLQSKINNGSVIREKGTDEKKEKKSRHHDKEETREKSVRKKDRSSSRDHGKKESKEKRRSSRDKDKPSGKSKKKEEKNGESEKENGNNFASRKISIDEGHFEDGEMEILTKEEGAVHADEEPSGTAKTEDSGIADDLGNELEPVPPPPAQRQQNRLMTASGRPQTSMGRPGTAMARPAPPKLKKKQVAEVEREVEPVAETSTVIVDERNENDEDFVVESDPAIESIERVDADQIVSDEHGGLVRKILETKKELEAGIDEDAPKFSSTSVFDENERDRTKKEVEKMQKAIQQLTQTTHPLARLFDYIQEDVDSMVKEMDDWRNETKRNTMELRERNANSVDNAERLLMTLKELEDEIKEMRTTIAHTNANIIINEQKIRTLVQNL
ncbi:TRAF3-interacting protein 1 [Toxocara canis]|uniref:TRAF3-interacting protein 1 n=1 Tax=Toxocara canis TaxID=6265 RepID=A0A0B2UYE5_TOXCA|nr:TRAF3-interacting protein 1 [Toxocara canis]